MEVSIHQLVATVRPDLYCEPSVRKDVERAVRDGLKSDDPDTFLKAAQLAVPVEQGTGTVDPDNVTDVFSLEILKDPVQRRVYVRDAMAESLEAFYFQLLDLVSQDERWQVSKLVDSFEPAPGAPSHAEFSRRVSQARFEARQLMESSRLLVQAVLQDSERLQTEQDRLRYYDDLKSEDLDRHDVALVHLKQHWLETVEQRHGSMSLLQLNSRFPHRDILNRFLSGNPLLEAQPDWVDRTLSQREDEFSRWLQTSGTRLRKTLEIRRAHMRHQLDLLRANARWLSPWLQELGQPSAIHSPSLIKGFNTSHLRLVLLVDGRTLLEERLATGELPGFLGHRKLRRYVPVVVVELEFRATGGAGRGLRGRAKVRISGYGLSEQELQVVRREGQRAALHQTIAAVEASARETVDRVAEFVEPDLKSPTSEAASASPDSNPFSALFSFFRSIWRSLFGHPPDALQRRDSHLEKVKRSVAIVDAAAQCRMLVDELKGLSH